MKGNQIIRKYGNLNYPEIKALLKKSQNKLSTLKIKKKLIDNEIESVENSIEDIEVLLSNYHYYYEDNTWLNNDNVIILDEVFTPGKLEEEYEISKKTNLGENNENN